MANNGINGTARAFEEFAVNAKTSFDHLRKVILETGDMFLFGLPTPNILDIMTKMYHENVVRNVLREGINAYHGQKGAQLASTSKKNPNVNFMCGIMELNDGNIYITISESPISTVSGFSEDNAFHTKEAVLRKMLEYCNIKVTDAEHGNQNAEKVYRKNQAENIGWRIEGDTIPQLDGVLSNTSCDKINKYIFANNCKQDHNYDEHVYKEEKTVQLINSFNYLRIRRNDQKSFVPLKKYDVNSGKFECNNGSTCTESKLFSYLYGINKAFVDIVGMGVFWVGKDLPPDHHLKNYCYAPGAKLDKILQQSLEILEQTPTRLSEYLKQTYPENYVDVMKNVVQAFAISCPGCFSNYQNYKHGVYATWDSHDCYVQLNPRTQRQQARDAKKVEASGSKAAASSGGRSRNKTKKNKRVKHRRTTRRV